MNTNFAMGQLKVSRVRGLLYEALERPREGGRTGRLLNRALTWLIGLNLVAVVLETVEPVRVQYGEVLNLLEKLSIVVFVLEYSARAWVSTCDHRFARPFVGRLRYLLTPLALVDLIAIVPAVLGAGTTDLRFLRALRLLRMLRVWKLSRYSRPLQDIAAAFHQCKGQLIAVGVILCVIVIISSGLMYVVEHPAQPREFSSLLASMWWTLETLSLISYGDMQPITPAGKLIGILIGVIGVGMFAMPAGILASAFIDQIKQSPAPSKACPHCGKDLSARDE